MTLSELQAQVGALTNDPNYDRYSLSDINAELGNSQTKWNLSAKILKLTTSSVIIAGSNYFGLTPFGTPTNIVLAYDRVTLDSLPLKKRSKAWMDLYTGTNWSAHTGTPTIYYIDVSYGVERIYLYPTPTSADAGKSLVYETITSHIPMSSSTDRPFQWYAGSSSFLTTPYDYGLAYDAAARLLLRDPSTANAKKSEDYKNIANGVLDQVIQTFKALEAEEPKRLSGGRYWNSGYIHVAK